jgi:uncharacterized circularly permuted ATP-grasp superfamily protein
MSTAEAYNRLLAERSAEAVEQADWLHDAFARRGVTFDGVAMRSFLRPHFVERRVWNVLRDSGRRIMELAARVARDAFDGDARRLCGYLGTPAAEARWVSLDPGPPDVLLSRLDAFLLEDGPRFIEINSDAPAGFGYGDRMAEVFLDMPLFRAFADEHHVSYLRSGPRLVEAVLGTWHGTGTPVLAIVDWSDVKTRADQEILQQAFMAAGVRCVMADPRSMRISRGRLVTAEDVAIDVVYRRGVLSELVAREDEVREFLEAYRRQLAVFVNSFRCHLSEDKAFFGLLTDEAFASLMSADERALVLRHVPWTRKVEERRTIHAGQEVDLVPHAIAAREHLVLKPAHGYGGDSVYVGDETDDATWGAALQRALGKPWVLQERVPIPEEVFPFCEGGVLTFEPRKVNANPFYVAGAEVGAVTRASRSSVINVSAGGGSSPTFVVG